MIHTILGAGGFAGNALAHELIKQNVTVRLVSRNAHEIQRRQITLRLALDGFDLFVGGNVVLISSYRQQQDLLETFVFSVWKSQDGQTVILAGQVAGDLRHAQDALGDDKS